MSQAESEHKIIPYDQLELYHETAVGSGGFGQVFKAKHNDLKLVAYKCLTIYKQKAEKLLKNEVSILMKLDHPNIVKVFGMVCEERQHGIVLEFAAHGDLLDFLSCFQVPWAWKLHIAGDIVCGMNYLHGLDPPIIHGDLKARNILVTDGYKAQISDFGLARSKEYSCKFSRNASQAGTVTHIAPERWTDINLRPDQQQDVYAFGILLWELMVYPKRPFEEIQTAEGIRTAVLEGRRPDLNDVPSDLPDCMSCVKSMIEGCWSQLTDHRPTFLALKNDLEELMSSHEEIIEDAKTQILAKQCFQERLCLPSYVRTRTMGPEQAVDYSYDAEHFRQLEKADCHHNLLHKPADTIREASAVELSSGTSTDGQQDSAPWTARQFCSWLNKQEWTDQFYYRIKEKTVHIGFKDGCSECAEKELKSLASRFYLPNYELGKRVDFQFHSHADDSGGQAESVEQMTHNGIKLRPGVKLKSSDNYFLFSGSLAGSGISRSTGISVGHPLEQDHEVHLVQEECNTRIGHCQSTVGVMKLKDDDDAKVTSDIAFLNLSDECYTENVISLENGRTGKLRIYKNEDLDDQAIMIIDQDGNFCYGRIRMKYFTDKKCMLHSNELHNVLTISSDEEPKDVSITREGDSGALVMSNSGSLSKEPVDIDVPVHGIVIGILRDEEHSTSFTVANDLWCVLQALYHDASSVEFEHGQHQSEVATGGHD